MTSLITKTDGDKIGIREILGALEHRGFGPLLIAPALLIILPSGAIPGLPAICGIFMLLVSFQILIGKSQPWLPKKLKNIAFNKGKFKRGFEKIKPYTKTIDNYVQNRLEFLAQSPIAKRFVALVSGLLSVGIIFIGFVPMMPALLALPILFFALGLSVRDGVLMVIGYITFAITLFSLPFMMGG